MREITIISLLKKKGFAMVFLLFCSFFISENSFSIEHWNRDYIKLTYVKTFNTVLLYFKFFDLDISEKKENSYLEWCKFEYSTDGENYQSFMRCESYNQMPVEDIFNTKLWVNLTHKLDGAKITLDGCLIPKIGTMWADDTNLCVAVYTFNRQGKLTVTWELDLLHIKNIRVTGKWTVNGLYCPDYFSEVYDVSPSEPEHGLKANNKSLKVFKQDDAIVIKGAGIGEKINIYTNSGAPIKSIVANNELVTIKLPAKQVYLVNIGQTRYKVAL